jgi:hypothetical protein
LKIFNIGKVFQSSSLSPKAKAVLPAFNKKRGVVKSFLLASTAFMFSKALLVVFGHMHHQQHLSLKALKTISSDLNLLK